MLKCEVSRNPDKVTVEATGKTSEILTDLCVIFNVVYHQLVASSPEAADGLKGMLKLAFMDDESPFWKDMEVTGDSTAVRIEVPKK